MKQSCIRITCLILTAMLPAIVQADEAGQVFESLYGPKIKQVSATVDRADDIALAKEMLAVAKDSGSTPRLQALLCDAAGDLAGKHPDGFATAVEAMQLLAGAQDGQRDAARVKLIDLLTKQSRTGKAEERAAASDELIDLLITMGDEKLEKKQYAEAAADYRRANTVAVQRKSEQLETIKAKTEFAAARDRAVKQIARLQEKLLKDANDHATAEEIVKLFVVELDDPAEASKLLSRVKDERLKKLVPLAALSISSLDAPDLLETGEWYGHLAATATAPMKETMLRHATARLKLYLEGNHGNELSRTKAEVMFKAAAASLAAIEPSKPRERSGGRQAEPINWAVNKTGNGYPRPTASHTSSQDRNIYLVIDGAIDYRDGSRNRWTSYESPNKTDWLEIDFGEESKVVSRIELAVYDDAGGVQAPESYDVEYYDGKRWKSVRNAKRSPEKPKGNEKNRITFEEVKTVKVRIVFTHAGRARSGLSEIEVWNK